MSRITHFDALISRLFDRTSHYRFPHVVKIPGSGTGSRVLSGLSTRPVEHAGMLDVVKARPRSVECYEAWEGRPALTYLRVPARKFYGRDGESLRRGQTEKAEEEPW
jgi:hypothetical protein